MEYRAFYLAREWIRMGHQVTIVASSASHVRVVSPTVSVALTREIVDGVTYHWLKTPAYTENGFKRGLNILAFVAQLYRFAGLWINEVKPDLVITSSTHPLDNLPGKWIARRAKAKLIYEVHDLWPLSLIELGGMSTCHPFIKLVQWAENYAYCHVDYVVSLLPEALPHMQAHGLPPHKFVYVPNGIDTAEWEEQNAPLPAEHQQVITSARANAKLLIGYVGAHGLANALDTILDAARLLRNEPVAFFLVGHGPEKARLENRRTQDELKNVWFLPPVLKATVPSLLAEMDALYIGLQRQPLFRFGVSPNKLIDYMMAGKPIVYAIAAGNDPVSDTRCGLSIPPEDPTSLAQAVRQLLITPSSELLAMGTRAREYCLQEHDYRSLALRFLCSVS
ncbi:MAG: glycosyltransferase family 4 protein [Anaerolineales bacterium]|nr:glycosyltransferase family 4 protein [Anaerolineales bacterium]